MTIIVCDLEATCWSAEDHPELRQNQDHECEIIEIGAVRVDPETYALLDTFERFAQAVRHPVSDFCTELTSITQFMVDEASPYPEVWQAFVDWIGVPLDEVTFISWGSFDQRQFFREASRHGLPDPRWAWVDAKRDYGDWRKWTCREKGRWGLHQAIFETGLEWQGRQHRGLDDALNVAHLLAHIRAPERASEEAQLVRRVLAERDPEPTQRGHVVAHEPLARRWYDRACKELRRAGAVTDLPHGQGMVLTPRGRAANG